MDPIEQEKILLTHEEKKVLAYNMNIIQALWKSIKGDLGRNMVRGNEYNVDSLYGSLEKSRQTIRDIIYMERDFEKYKINEWAYRIEKKTGIPQEYLTGAERIKLGSSFEEEFFPMYEDYIANCDYINEQLAKAKENPLDWSMPKMKKFIKKNRDTNKRLDELIKKAERTVKLMTEFDRKLDEEINRVKEIASVRGLRENPKRYKLIYFIKYGKKQNAIGIEKVQDITRVMEDIRTAQLKELGEAGLSQYIEALKKHLKLAESVYTVAVDCGDFKI